MKKSFFFFLIVCLLTSTLLTGCSKKFDCMSFLKTIHEYINNIEVYFGDMEGKNDSENIIDSDFEDEETLYLGEQSIAGMDIAEGEVVYIG